MSASLAAKTDGAVAQYGLAGKNAAATIKPYDSGNILGTVPPGKAGIKLVDGTIQNATALTADSSAGVVGNALLCSNRPTAQGDPVVNSAQIASNGLSISPQTE